MTDRLERNLRALSLRSPAAALAIAQAEVPVKLRLFAATDGHICGEDARDCNAPRLLASAHDPANEAAAWAQAIDVKQAAVIAVRGAGLWHHIFTLADRMKRSGAIVVYDPDLSLLKLALSHIDITPLLNAMPISLVTDASDIAQIASSLEGIEGMVATGLLIVDHPPSRARLGLQRSEAGNASTASSQHPAMQFAQGLTAAVQAVRTSVVTTLVQIETTIENLLGNLPLYIDGHGIADIAESERGKPAIIVSAGPSLRKNIDLLSQPGVRDRVVIIAVQTVLKQLLARGIKPHYVTALDYHPISTRFYEGLTARDVQGITLVIDPKAHPAIARAFPGTVRVAASEILDTTLGEGLARPMGEVAAGATVAHLAYYLAKHLGCKDIVLIGQDLGFTDNQYYSAGAAIHNVWSSELSDVCTLEGLEWQRIVRMRALLRRVPGALGTDLYADEQMHTYRVQFEREFERDTRSGIRIIDATEGGARKQHAIIMPLANALREYASKQPSPARAVPPPCSVRQTPRVARTLARLDALALAADSIAATCCQAHATLSTLLAMYSDREAFDDQRSDALIAQAHALARTTTGNIALWLVEHLNQTGQLKRFKADRAMLLSEGLDARATQQCQVQRDTLNVQWLRDAAQQTADLLRWAKANVQHLATGEPPIERARQSADVEGSAKLSAESLPQSQSATPQSSVYAFMHAHPARSGLGIKRSWNLIDNDSDSLNVFTSTVNQLLACNELAGILIACAREHTSHVRDALQRARITCDSLDSRVWIVEHDAQSALAHHRASVRAARCLQRHSWRGGAGQLCVYDEAICPRVDHALLQQHIASLPSHLPHPTAILAVGDDWCALDSALCDALIARHKAHPSRHRMVFCQVPPGLAGIVIDCSLIHELSQSTSTAGSWWNTIGGMLGYHPLKPQMDAIAKDICLAIPAPVRDTLLRCTGDDTNFRRIFKHAHSLSSQPHDASQWCSLVSQLMADVNSHPHIERIDLDTTQMTSDDIPIYAERIARLCDQHPALVLSLTIGDAYNACECNWPALVDVARECGVWALHVRCSHDVLLAASDASDTSMLSTLLTAPIDLLSVDLPGDRAEHWPSPSAREATWESLQTLLDRVHARTSKGTLPLRWLAAHMPKTSQTLEDMELFYDRWMLACGTAVIEGQQQHSLPKPAHLLAREQWSRTRLGPAPSIIEPAQSDRDQHSMVFNGISAAAQLASSQPLEGAI